MTLVNFVFTDRIELHMIS